MGKKLLFTLFFAMALYNILKASPIPKKHKSPKSGVKNIYAVCTFLDSEEEAYSFKKNLLNENNKHASIFEIDEKKFYSSRYNLLDTYLEE